MQYGAEEKMISCCPYEFYYSKRAFIDRGKAKVNLVTKQRIVPLDSA